ncbi:MAG: DUF5658 family protein [Actinomycetota bacterium]|nr:DUF5658 family protein [Actinomycetota bacterium]
MLFLLIYFNFLDGLLTILESHFGLAVEANPLHGLSTHLFWGYKFLMVPILIYLLWRLSPRATLIPLTIFLLVVLYHLVGLFSVVVV